MQRITGEKRKSISNQVPPSKLKSIFDRLKYCSKRLPPILVQLEYWIIRFTSFRSSFDCGV